jgi:hypothetical protein
MRDPTTTGHWRRLPLPPDATTDALGRVVITCSSFCSLRVVTDERSNPALEILCNDPQEGALAEARVHQAIADQLLRTKLKSKFIEDERQLLASVFSRAKGTE